MINLENCALIDVIVITPTTKIRGKNNTQTHKIDKQTNKQKQIIKQTNRNTTKQHDT